MWALAVFAVLVLVSVPMMVTETGWIAKDTFGRWVLRAGTLALIGWATFAFVLVMGLPLINGFSSANDVADNGGGVQQIAPPPKPLVETRVVVKTKVVRKVVVRHVYVPTSFLTSNFVARTGVATSSSKSHGKHKGRK